MSVKKTNLEDRKYGTLHLNDPPESMLATKPNTPEPVFVLRAQDDMAMHTLTRYRNTMSSIEDDSKRPSAEWFAHMDAVLADFMQFRHDNPDRMKVAD